MKKILITGSLGLVGSACMETFAAKGWHVEGLDNNGRAQFFGTPLRKGTHHAIDICNGLAVNELMNKIRPDAIIHAAGQPSHDWATEHVLEDFEVNTYGTLILLEATRKYCPDATFVYVSTDKVYGENMRAPELLESDTRYSPAFSYGALHPGGFTEDLGLDFAGDRSLFGCSKAAADMYVQCYGAKFGMKTACFRPGCITGKNHAGAEQHGFMAYLAQCIKNGVTYKIHGTGKQVRDQIHASDLAQAFYACIQNPKVSAVYNMGGGPERSVSVLEASKLLSEALGKPFLHEYAPERAGDRRYDVHDISKFCRDYPSWNYKYSLSDIIADLT